MKLGEIATGTLAVAVAAEGFDAAVGLIAFVIGLKESVGSRQASRGPSARTAGGTRSSGQNSGGVVMVTVPPEISAQDELT